CGDAASEFLDLNHTSKSMNLVSLFDSEVRTGSDLQTQANFGIGTLERIPKSGNRFSEKMRVKSNH
ncbi:MAG: hypothetical protein ACLFPA_07725, partial [Dichotomicrobium sp.]